MYIVTIWQGSRVFSYPKRTWAHANAWATAYAKLHWSTMIRKV